MADLLKNVFGGGKPGVPAAKVADADFADFAGAPDPIPEAAATTATLVGGGPAGAAATGVPWTKWYNVHERHSLSEFKVEGVILVIAGLVFVFHILGTRANRSKARAWMRANAPALRSQFALVGFSGVPTIDAGDDLNTDSLLKEKSLFEYSSYATGRQNTAFMDVKITMSKKFNPIVNVIEKLAGYLIETMQMPEDIVEATIYPFDGKENLTLPSLPGAAEVRAKDSKSSYEGFVWAIVNKDRMQKLRDDRYDVSLTSTKDHPKLPNWLTVMSESAEVTDTFLTPELAAAITSAGQLFDYLVISDQPSTRPTTLDETLPRKRIFLKYHMPSDSNYDSLLALFGYFLQLPDILVQQAHFRPEVMKKVRASREQMISQIKKAAEEEKNEERLIEKDKVKKAKRDAELKGLDAKAQKKFLEKEKEKEMRKSQKKQTMRG